MEHAAPRVGLVLGAGGVAGGAFHAGVLAALEEATGWGPRHARIVVGTSAGSVTGASLRAGLSATDMLARAEDRPLSAAGARVLRNVRTPGPIGRRPPSRQGNLPSQVVTTMARAAARPLSVRPWALLASLLPEGTVSTGLISNSIDGMFPRDRWPAEALWVCAVHQSDGRRIVFGRDAARPPLANAVAASCAIPAFFNPATIDGEAYIDGGVHSPTNADVLRSSADDLDLVLVSSPMSISGRRLSLGTDQAVRRWSGSLLDAEAVRLRRRGLHVLAFQPTADDAAVMGLNAMDPSRRAPIARQARESTLRRLERADTRARLAPLVA